MFLSSCQIVNIDVLIGVVYDLKENNNGCPDLFRATVTFRMKYPVFMSGFNFCFSFIRFIQPLFLNGLHPFVEARDESGGKDRIDCHTEYNGCTQ